MEPARNKNPTNCLRVHGQRCDVSQIVSQACNMFEVVAESREIGLRREVEPDILVEGNAYHLRQVANNLIDNALKFTPSGGSVTVDLRRSHELGMTWVVSDTGTGIAPADLTQVFKRFFRADRARSHEGVSTGTGLGLSICQAVVDAHGGTIAVESALGGGTTFTVWLPAAPRPAPDDDGSVRPAQSE